MSSPLEYPHRDAPAPGTAREIAPGVHWLRMALPFAHDHNNLWLLEDAGGWTMVDTGLGDEATRGLWERVFAGTFGGRPVRRVLVTHYHPDHAGNAGWLCARFGVPLWMTQGEYLTAHAVREGVAGYVPGATLALFRANGLEDARHAQMATRGNLSARQVPSFPRATAASWTTSASSSAAANGACWRATGTRPSMPRSCARNSAWPSPATCCCRGSPPT